MQTPPWTAQGTVFQDLVSPQKAETRVLGSRQFLGATFEREKSVLREEVEKEAKKAQERKRGRQFNPKRLSRSSPPTGGPPTGGADGEEAGGARAWEGTVALGWVRAGGEHCAEGRWDRCRV